MQKPLSYLGFVVIPIISAMLVFFAYFGYYLANQRLYNALLITASPQAFMSNVGRAHQHALIIHQINEASPAQNRVVWQRSLSVSPKLYQCIRLYLTMPKHYRGLELAYQTRDGNTHIKPILYTVDGVAEVSVDELLLEGAVLTKLQLMIKHELTAPIVLQSIQVVPKSITVPRFFYLIKNHSLSDYLISENHQGASQAAFLSPSREILPSPLIFFVWIGGITIIFMLLIYQRLFGTLVCVFSSVAMMAVVFSLLSISFLIELSPPIKQYPIKSSVKDCSFRQSKRIVTTPENAESDWLIREKRNWFWGTSRSQNQDD